MTFFITKNIKLESSILEIILRMFNQKQEFIENLSKFQIYFEKDDIRFYKYVENKVEECYMLGSRSEVKLIHSFLYFLVMVDLIYLRS